RETSELFLPHDSALPLLKTVLHSDDVWIKARRILTRPGAANQITAMQDGEFEQIQELAMLAKESFDWQCIREDINAQSLMQALRTCALLIARLTNSEGDVYSESDRLGRAADEANATALREWILEDPWHDVWLQQGNRLS